MDKLYQGIRRNELFTAGLVGYFLGFGTMTYSGRISDYFFPGEFNNPQRVKEIDYRLKQPVSLTLEDLSRDYPQKLSSLDETASNLIAERDSLKSLPDFEKQMRLLDKKRNLDNYLPYGAMVFSTLFLIPLYWGMCRINSRRRQKV